MNVFIQEIEVKMLISRNSLRNKASRTRLELHKQIGRIDHEQILKKLRRIAGLVSTPITSTGNWKLLKRISHCRDLGIIHTNISSELQHDHDTFHFYYLGEGDTQIQTQLEYKHATNGKYVEASPLGVLLEMRCLAQNCLLSRGP